MKLKVYEAIKFARSMRLTSFSFRPVTIDYSERSERT